MTGPSRSWFSTWSSTDRDFQEQMCSQSTSTSGGDSVPEEMGAQETSQAFFISWNSGLMYAFSPVPMLLMVLRKLKQDTCITIIIIAPACARELILGSSETVHSDLIALPVLPDLSSQDSGQVFHSNLESLPLTAWVLAG